MLDKRHEAHVKRFAKAKTVAEVRALWLESLERGDIPGAYWAVLTHPATDQPLVTEVFGGQANAVLFPVDCVSHQAAVQVKRLCQASGKPFKPLRNAGIASFLAAIEALEGRAPARAAI